MVSDESLSGCPGEGGKSSVLSLSLPSSSPLEDEDCSLFAEEVSVADEDSGMLLEDAGFDEDEASGCEDDDEGSDDGGGTGRS